MSKNRVNEAYGCLPMVAILVIAFAIMFVAIWRSPAQAHAEYSGIRDPVTGSGCCGGKDCAPVPIDAEWVRPLKDGFQVTMTVDQAKSVNPDATAAINVMVPWARVMMISNGADGPPAIYHVCIWSNELKCLFVVPGT